MIRLRHRRLAAALLFTGATVLSGCNGASDVAVAQLGSGPTGFTLQTLVRGNRTRKYGLFVPFSYRKDIPITKQAGYPVIIFLHGVGEGGSDGRKNLTVGLAPFVEARAADFNFICIFPQSESGNWNEYSEDATDVIPCLEDVARHFPVDKDRVSLTGLSTGGYGTWAIGAKYKDYFAALAPMGSSASAEKYADQLVDMPVQAFHNSGDPIAPSWNDSTLIARLTTLGNVNAKYIEYPVSGHDCWDTAYGDGELFSWLLAQHRSQRGIGGSTDATPTIEGAPTAHSIPARRASAAPVEEPDQARANASAEISTPF